MNLAIFGLKIRKGRYVAYIVPRMMKELKLDRYTHTLYISMVKGLEDPGQVAFDGRLFKMDLDYTKSVQEVGLAAAHELIHVQQYASGRLKNLGNNRRSWCGKVYEAVTPYLEQPWELGALREQEILLRKVLD
jgi:hypothetical protein